MDSDYNVVELKHCKTSPYYSCKCMQVFVEINSYRVVVTISQDVINTK
jgi:hypothetical protein